MPSDHYRWNADTLLLYCYLQPKASSDEIVGLHDGQLKIRITAPPSDGQANNHLLKFLSRCFGVPKSSVTLEKGFTGRQKTVSIIAPQKIPDKSSVQRFQQPFTDQQP